MSLVEEDAVDNSFYRFINGGVLEDDVCGLASKFEGCFLMRRRDCPRNRLSDFGGSSKGDLVDSRMINKSCTCAAITRDDIYYSRWKFGLLADLGEKKGS